MAGAAAERRRRPRRRRRRDVAAVDDPSTPTSERPTTRVPHALLVEMLLSLSRAQVHTLRRALPAESVIELRAIVPANSPQHGWFGEPIAV